MNHSSRTLRQLIAAIVIALVGVLATACSSTPGTGSVTYAPAAYGVQAGSTFDCYYIESPLEAADLINAGLCPRGSVASVMPLSWEETYWSYYDSTAYYDTYMPASYRARYTSVYVVHFKTTYSRQISAYSSKGTYKSSSGKTDTGASGSKLKFGTSSSGSSGSGRTVHGGGSGSGTSACSMPMTILSDKSGGSTSHGGGSGSSSSRSGTSSRSGSGSRGGC